MNASTVPVLAAPPPCLCRPKRVGFGRGIFGEFDPTGEEVVGARPGGVWVHMNAGSLLVAEVAMGRRRRTSCASRPPQGGVAWAGVGQFCGGLVKVRAREMGLEGVGRGGLCGEIPTSGCSCTTTPVSRPSRVGVTGDGSGRLRGIERKVCWRWGRGMWAEGGQWNLEVGVREAGEEERSGGGTASVAGGRRSGGAHGGGSSALLLWHWSWRPRAAGAAACWREA